MIRPVRRMRRGFPASRLLCSPALLLILLLATAAPTRAEAAPDASGPPPALATAPPEAAAGASAGVWSELGASAPLSTPESLAGALDALPTDPTDEAATAGIDAGDPTDGYDGPQGIRPGPRPGGRPLELTSNAMVVSLRRYFTGPKRDVLERGWRRAGRYLPMIRRVLREEGVPEQLAYLAAVESNFNPHARSPARAVGMWQFTAPTARKFGLHIKRPWYDERIDPVSSTHAAARLLAYLYDRYEDWALALAAYNAGEARVNAALEHARRRGRPADYWRLRLPRQTRGFVPAFLAIAAIMEAPQANGLDPADQEPPLESEVVEIHEAASLPLLARRLGLPREALRRRNPAWSGAMMPALRGTPVLLWVPPGVGARLPDALAADGGTPAPWLVHTVREGETVSGIALRYAVPVSEVLALNHLHARSLIGIGQPLLVPVPPGTQPAPDPRAVPVAAVGPTGPAMTQLVLHRVLSGESLWSIARNFGVRMEQLRAWNRLDGRVLQPGQELVLFPAEQKLAER